MILKNGYIYDENFDLVKKDILINGEIISEISSDISGDDIIDCTGKTILPGFIDIHIHGRNLADTCDELPDAVSVVSESLLDCGVTSFCPTTMTLPHEALKRIFCNIKNLCGKESGAYIHGINMEGPYISLEKKGAQKAEYVRNPDIDEFRELYNICKISLVDIAPESENAFDFAKSASKFCTVSAAHTAADYGCAVNGFNHGITHATHLFNAMTGITARNPGVAGAVLDSDNVKAEIICDGFHVAPAVLRLVFKTLGEDRTIVISDSMKAAGCDDGDYNLGGQAVYVRDGKALLKDGTIAASTSNLFDEYLNLLRFGIDRKQALKSCTINPATSIGVQDKTGSLKEGKFADILILNSENSIDSVFVKGKKKR